MRCPFCHSEDSRVIDSREIDEGDSVRRRRSCSHCGERFNTLEKPDLKLPAILKSDGRREPFADDKLRNGMLRALQKRPVPMEKVDAAFNTIKHEVQALGESEVSARAIGEMVMRELRRLDDVAYVRFASVYKRFEDPSEFSEEVNRLRTPPAAPSHRDKPED